MKENAYKTSRSLCFLALSLVYILNNHRAIAAPQPLTSETLYGEEYGLDMPSQILVERLKKMVDRKQEKIEKEIEEVAEEQMEIQSFIAAHQKNQQDQPVYLEEELSPAAAALSRGELSHPAEKRNYIALCHFKICNMGRKRQKRSAGDAKQPISN